MPNESPANQQQAELWNGPAGHTWVEMQSVLEGMLEPFNGLLIEQSVRESTDRVLDVGCGGGSTTLSVARRLGRDGSCLGVDVSAPLIELAKKRSLAAGLNRAAFVRADAQVHAFEPNDFDAVISRFGVMFFDDPVAAFANIKRAARASACLTFVAWRSPAENPFMTTGARAAAGLLPSLRVPEVNTPGQFGLADPDRVRYILEASGWSNIAVRPVDVPIQIAERDLATYITRLGPVGLALKEADEQLRAQTATVVRAAYEPFVRNGAARFNAACWLVTARA